MNIQPERIFDLIISISGIRPDIRRKQISGQILMDAMHAFLAYEHLIIFVYFLVVNLFVCMYLNRNTHVWDECR